jgi:ribosome-associated translation inhibitor RaiA
MSMRIESRSLHAERETEAYAERRVSTALGRHREHVSHVLIRIEREGLWHKCRVLVALKTNVHRMIVVEASSDDSLEAVDHAAERAAARVFKACERVRERPSERVVSRLLTEAEESDAIPVA